jgi:hypothetical protein
MITRERRPNPNPTKTFVFVFLSITKIWENMWTEKDTEGEMGREGAGTERVGGIEGRRHRVFIE